MTIFWRCKCGSYQYMPIGGGGSCRCGAGFPDDENGGWVNVPRDYVAVDDGEYVFGRPVLVEMVTYDIPETPKIRYSGVFEKKVFYRCAECDKKTLAAYRWWLKGMTLVCECGGSADYERKPRGYLVLNDNLDE